ncbi:hypothetical protein KW444_02385 [Vibrio fluvialis]|nr:hypothetical protein [Vibrio fluvialis]
MSDVAKVYLSLYSVDSLNSANIYEDIEGIAECLREYLTVYERSNNVHVECPTDFFDFGEVGSSLEDTLLAIVNDNWDQYQLAYSELSKVVLGFVKNNDTQRLISLINHQQLNLPRHYSFVISDSYQWPNVAADLHTDSWTDTLRKNSKFISDHHSNIGEFISWSKMNYEYLDFHPNLINTLSTIKVGTYLDYKEQLSHGLNTLNQAYHLISTDANQNQADLNVIAEHTHRLGKSLGCSRQGSNKVPTIFKKPPLVTPSGNETINCEYHLKIDNKDNGQPIPHGKGNPVRIYFGLKTYNEYERKQFKLAHMGKHL